MGQVTETMFYVFASLKLQTFMHVHNIPRVALVML
jgi:hypothetical protein